MKSYNLYYKGIKLNRRPMTKKDIDIVMSKELVSKIVNNTTMKDIPTKECQIVEVTVL